MFHASTLVYSGEFFLSVVREFFIIRAAIQLRHLVRNKIMSGEAFNTKQVNATNFLPVYEIESSASYSFTLTLWNLKGSQ